MSSVPPETQLIAMLLAIIAEQTEMICQLQETVKALEDRLNKNSSNSSKPPSTDGFTRPGDKKQEKPSGEDNDEKPSPKSLRSSSGLKPGAQKGHKGFCLEAVENPQHIEYLPIRMCEHCHQSLPVDGPVKFIECQVFEPARPGQFEVTAYRAEVRRCTCGHRNQALWPEGVTGYVQYGPITRAMAVYLHQYQLIPCHRIAEFFQDIYHMPVSVGSVCHFQKTTYEQLESTELAIASALLHEAVLGADETGMRVDRKTWWLHALRSEYWTLYHLSPKRGRVAMDAMSVLLLFTGVLVHDHWKPYFHYGVIHALCNAHHLRELQGVIDRDCNRYAARMMRLLQFSWHITKGFRKIGMTVMPAIAQVRIEQLYQQILAYALRDEEAFMERRRQYLNAKRVRRTKAYNLFRRLRDYQAETLRFLTDFRVPFDNNGSERDVRMGKLKAKISGCFRSKAGAAWFSRIRSYISSARKQGLGIFESLLIAVENYGRVPLLGAE